MLETIGRICSSYLCTFGKQYNLGVVGLGEVICFRSFSGITEIKCLRVFTVEAINSFEGFKLKNIINTKQ